MKLRTYISALALACVTLNATGQEKDYGTLSGSLESNTIYYRNDSTINAIAPKDKIGSNNYLKLDYRYGAFSAGLQYEAYLPPLVGYSTSLEGNEVVHRYASYNSDFLSFTVGNFYEQFGSGLIFRAYEERSLGVNNSLDGVSIKVKPTEYLQIKALWGKQRKDLTVGKSNIRGADAEFSISQLLLPESPVNISLGGSWVRKYQDYTGPIADYPTSIDAFAGRAQIDYAAYSIYGEYVHKKADPEFINKYSYNKGKAILIQQSLTLKGLGLGLNLRRLENIDFRSDRDERGSANTLNYLPALTRQHKYQLASLHPYSTQAASEIGGQVDLFYSFKKGSAIGGATGLKVSANASVYYNLARNSNGTYKMLGIGDTLLFQDLNIEIEKKLSSKIRLSVSYINQQYNKGVITGDGKGMVKTHIAVADVLYKFSPTTSLRTEISELWGVKGEDDWTQLLAELSFAPKWSIFASDLVQHRENKVHYYNTGLSYTYSTTKISASFGRNKEGLQCVGGMCRYVPAYSGFSLSVVSSF
ncbi:MAG: DUF6029 family protein [Tenuifilaceae bacterium]|jgi:hypothetical protein|nr:DUF6029 family protein [Tenuifilaceae bacterium]